MIFSFPIKPPPQEQYPAVVLPYWRLASDALMRDAKPRSNNLFQRQAANFSARLPLNSVVMTQRAIVRKSIAATLIAASALLTGCSDEYSTKDYEVGPNGEPPKALKKIYTKEFVSEQKNYVRALGEVHAFLIGNDFSSVVYNTCFKDVLDVRVTANSEKHKRAFPCVAVQSTKGAEVTNTYLRVSINDVKFNQLDHNNRVIYTVEIYGKEGPDAVFAANVEPALAKLYSFRPAQHSLLPHDSPLNQDSQPGHATSRQVLQTG